MLISFPMVDKLLSKNKKSIYDNYRNILEKSAKKYMDDTGFLVSGCYEVTFKDLKNQGMLNGIPDECSESKIYITSDDKGKATGYKVRVAVGKTKGFSGSWQPHAWTEVKVKGKWYIFDTNMDKFKAKSKIKYYNMLKASKAAKKVYKNKGVKYVNIK